MMTHYLKELPEYYQAIFDGRKTFEVRKNDRDYKVGDLLCLREWTENDGYTDRYMTMTVTYILDNSEFVKDGYIILGLAQPERVQIFNMTQNGNNNFQITNCGRLNL